MRAAALAGPPVRLPRRAEDVQHLSIARFIPKTRGSWRMFSAETEAASDEEQRLERETR